MTPLLTPSTGEEFSKSLNASKQARSDVSARGLWINEQAVICDIRILNPLARFHLHQSVPAIDKKNKNEKKREYNQRILQVEHGSFTRLVF